MKVVMADVEAPALDDAATQLRGRGFDVVAVPTDVSNAESVQTLAERTLAEYGKVHVVCNNAGVSVNGGTAWDRTLEDWKWCFDVNFWGVLHGIRTFVPILLAQGEQGHVVNTASAAALCLNSYGIYPVTKAAVISLSEYLYRGLIETGGEVGASVLCPSAVQTNILQSARNRPPELRHTRVKLLRSDLEMVRDFLHAARSGSSPAEIAAAVVDAIRRKRFWILPPPNREADIQARMESILSRRNPGFGSTFGES